MRRRHNDLVHASIKEDGKELWVTFTPSTILIGQGQLIFGKSVPVKLKSYWRKYTEKENKLLTLLKSEDEEILLIGLKMTHIIFNFKIKEIF